ncbi:MAG TPA: sulfatase-like hydrolase/transferase, partial [Terriglobales bacterium]|nr:sulfatase-like hydrolase/transferase [Terriglobales bacterium]
MNGISRRQFAGALASAAFAQNGRRPKNVLLLMSDQHKPHAMGIDGDPVARTPNLDGLCRSGVRFDSAYCSNPVCVPSRASLLTGLYTHNHRAYNNSVPWPFEHKTIAHHFDRAGYMTGLIGKMHFVDAQTHGFEYRVDFNDWWQYLGPKTKLYADELGRRNSGSGLPQIDDLWRDAGDPWDGAREKDDRQGSVAVGRASKMAEQDQFESFVARESIRFLKNHGREPFFLVSSFLKPHDPFMPAQRFADMFRPEDMKLPDTWGKVDLSKVPKEISAAIRRNAPTPELHDAEQAKRRIALYYGNLAQMDDCAGRVLTALRELDLEKDTIVLYTADHGEMLGEHGLWQKFVFYEPSVGVPLVVRAPGVTPAGARSKTPVSLVQALPTLLELCGLPAASGLDGTSFAQDLREPARKRDTTVFAEFNLR